MAYVCEWALVRNRVELKLEIRAKVCQLNATIETARYRASESACESSIICD